MTFNEWIGKQTVSLEGNIVEIAYKLAKKAWEASRENEELRCDVCGSMSFQEINNNDPRTSR